MDFCLRNPLIQALFGLLSLSAYAPDLAAQGHAAPDVSPGAAALALVRAEPQYAEAEVRVGTRVERTPERSASELPGLERQPDGGYRYYGTNFVATISPDGNVRFKNTFFGFARTMRPLPSPSPDALPSTHMIPASPPVASLQFKMDVFGWLEKKLGNDPYRSERRWFLIQTEELRDDLATRAAQQKLSSALAFVWGSASLSLQERKHETFELWNQSPPGPTGKIVREGVIAFIQARCPEGSACAFQAHELEELNKRRNHPDAFTPYAEESGDARTQEEQAPTQAPNEASAR